MVMASPIAVRNEAIANTWLLARGARSRSAMFAASVESANWVTIRPVPTGRANAAASSEYNARPTNARLAVSHANSRLRSPANNSEGLMAR